MGIFRNARGGVTVTGTEVIRGQAIGASAPGEGPAAEAAPPEREGGAAIVNTGVMCLGGTITITGSVISGGR